MRKPLSASALAASLLIALTACGDPSTNEGDEPASGATTTTATATDGEPTEQATEQHTGPAAIAESYGLAPVPAGESTVYEWSYSNRPEQTHETEVSVSEYECGLTAIPEGMSNPEWDGGNEHPQDIDALAEDGKTFCTFTVNYENVGNFPGNPPSPGGVLIGEQQHGQSTLDHDISWNIQDYAHDVNPGETWQYTHVVSVPEGTTPDALLYPQETFNDVPSIAFLLD